MTSHDLLPMEIFEAIIDQASDDFRSLRGLSLTCHVFLPRARYQLFSIIVLQTVQKVEAFNEFLDSHTWVSPLVQKLVHSSVVPVSDSDAIVRVVDAVPMHLLSRISNLHTWRMVIPQLDEGENPVWLQSGGPSALSRYPSYRSHVRNLELEFIYFENISAFIELVSAFSSVHTLTCSTVRIKPSIGSGHQCQSESVQLRSLRVSMFDPSLAYVRHTAEHASFRSLAHPSTSMWSSICWIGIGLG